MAFIGILTYLLVVLFHLALSQDCVVDDFIVQENLDLNKFAGRWYEQSWVPYYFEPPFDNYLDYSENYTVVNSSFVTAVSAGRVTRNDTYCINNTAEFTVTSNPAKWTSIKTQAGIEYLVDYWIIETDYVNYAFVYGCTRRYGNGTCQNVHSWKWSRSLTIEDEYMDKLDEAAERVCVTETYIESNQGEACPLEDDNTTSGAGIMEYSVLLVMILMIWI